MAEIAYNNQLGVLGTGWTAAGAPSAGTSQDIANAFAAAPDFELLASGDFIKIILDPKPTAAGNPNPLFEISYLTAYDPSSPLDGTFTRGAEDATNWPPAAHVPGTSAWGNSPTIENFQGDEVASLGIWLYGDGSDGPLLFTASPRTVTDMVVTPGSDVVTSATADFTSADVGLVLNDQSSLGALGFGTRIKSVTNGTTAVLTDYPNANADGADDDTVVIGAPDLVSGNYSSITIPTGATARPNYGATDNQPGVVTCSGEYYIDGTVDQSGQGAAVNPGGTGAGTPASSPWKPIGGNGGAGSTVSTGDTPGGTSSAYSRATPYALPFIALLGTLGGLQNQLGSGSPGGGDGVNNGGDGGNGGIGLTVAAKSIVHGLNASYVLTGQDGGAAAGGNAGGGGGGGDGWWVTLSDSLSGSPAIIGGGGAGGAGTGTGTDGTAGQPGFGVHYTPSGVTVQTP